MLIKCSGLSFLVYNPVRRANARQRYQTKQKMLKANPAKIINLIPPVMTKSFKSGGF